MIKSKKLFIIIPVILFAGFTGLKLSAASSEVRPLLEFLAKAKQQSLAHHYNRNCNKHKDTAEWTRLVFN